MAQQQLQPQLLLTVTVRNAMKAYVPTMFTRISHEYAAEKTCLDFLERLLREHGHAALADGLSEFEICLQCVKNVGVLNSFGIKRARTCEEINATTFLSDTIATTLGFINSDELLFVVTPSLPHSPTSRCRRDRATYASCFWAIVV